MKPLTEILVDKYTLRRNGWYKPVTGLSLPLAD